MTPNTSRPHWAALAAVLVLAPAGRAADPWTALADPENSLSVRVLRGGESVFRVGLAGWGPKWAWVGMQSKWEADGDGKPTKLALPVRGVRPGPVAATASLAFDRGGAVEVKFDPPCPVAFDNAMRVVLAADTFPKGKRSVTLTLTFPEDVGFLVKPADLEKFTKTPAGPDWFPFQPSKTVTPGVIDMTDWLDRPAGKRGGVRMVKDRFAFADGTPVKFWGTNLSYTASAPDRETADFTAARFARYGINAVRMHMFSYPTGQSGIGDPTDNLPSQKGGARRRLLDTAAFLHDVQNRFYTRFVKAIRDAGYRGPLCGSPWQAPSMLPHYYNLWSDYNVGFIDRHNYFEGAAKAMFASMLTRPGSGYFGSGMEQVADRPFALSEWISVYPNAYAAEGPAIVAAYGMGLQGWDASYEFQSQAAKRVFGDLGGNFPWGVWEADVPTSLGQYPTLARMVLRGDVKQGDVIAARRVSPTELAEGVFSFTDKVEQQGDVKTFTGTVPGEALAAGRVVVEFTDKPEPPQVPDMTRYRSGSVIRSVTGQLAWDTADRGFFTVDTPGTKAVVGFAQGKEQKLGDVTVRLDTPFAAFVLTARGRDEDLAKGKSALISVLARQSNTGFTYFGLDNRVLSNGGPPILLEPVKATVAVAGRPIEAVHILDHDGRRTGRTLPAAGGRFTLDGARDKAIYYEVVFR